MKHYATDNEKEKQVIWTQIAELLAWQKKKHISSTYCSGS
jgi:hypothetical protein